jgi:hypothetical protein
MTSLDFDIAAKRAKAIHDWLGRQPHARAT